ncbi:MAG: ABC transporter ATP-binding protein [Acidimicrobiales bacterium]|nr:ABC transporter ATP-binding protein [Acidimicrobiales bacterium]
MKAGETAGSADEIVVDDVRFGYPGAPRAVLDGLSLTVPAGERLAVLGPNGSGKTTFALHLNGLLTPERGTVAVGGLTLGPDTLDEVRRRVGLVFQDPDDQLFLHTVADDVAFGPANLGWDRTSRDAAVADALAAVGASDLAPRTSHHLSGGEKRRAALATVLSMAPRVLVLDEPTSGLDPRGRRELAELLDTRPETQVIVTHDLPFALAVCPRAVVLDEGRIVADAPTVDLLRDAERLGRHGLELPYGYAPPAATPGQAGG